MDMDRYNPSTIQVIQLAVRLAAGEAGIWAYDGAFANIQDPEGYRQEAEGARRLGYLGKSAIHPTQVPIANSVFRPTAAEITKATQIVEAARIAAQQGVGAYTVNGRMVDVPFVRSAERLLELARKLNLTS
jgi:citrate lyase subunit beta/citryl-CoA lyase